MQDKHMSSSTECRALIALLTAALASCHSGGVNSPVPNETPTEPFSIDINFSGVAEPLDVGSVQAEYVTTNAACAETSYLNGGSVRYGRYVQPVAVVEEGSRWLASGYYDTFLRGECGWSLAGLAVRITDADGRPVAVAPLSIDVIRSGSVVQQCIPSSGDTTGSCYRASKKSAHDKEKFFVHFQIKGM